MIPEEPIVSMVLAGPSMVSIEGVEYPDCKFQTLWFFVIFGDVLS